MMETRLPVHERFTTFQGEGCHAGRKAAFIRLFGCPVHCPWCDSAGTWHPDHIPTTIDRLAPEALAEEAAATQPEFVVITGGEPAIHNLGPLTTALHARQLPVHLETSGAFPLRGSFDWVTLSPKRWKMPCAEALAAASEFKLIIDEPRALAFYEAELKLSTRPCPVWLHPEWSQRDNPVILQQIIDAVHGQGAPFRAGWQLHKLYKVL